MLKILLSYSRVAIPLMLGICIGIALSFMVLPLLEESACEMRLRGQESELVGTGGNGNNNANNQLYKSKRSDAFHPFLEGLDLDSFRSAEFEPKVVTTEQSGAQTAQKPVRNRFMQSELSMKDPLFIAYLTSPDRFRGMATALNRTLVDYENDYGYRFFVNSDTRASMQSEMDLPIMMFNLLDPVKLPLLTIKYLMNQLKTVQLYKYYLVLPDTSYVRVDRLIDRLLKLEAGHFLGFSELGSQNSVCDPSVGFVISQVSHNQCKLQTEVVIMG